MNPAIKPILDGYPLPNAPTGPFGARTYETSSKVATNYDQFSIRLDQTLSSKSQFFGRFSYNQITGPVTNPNQTAIDPSFGVQFFDHQRNAALSYAREINPHLTLQALLGYIRQRPNFPAANHTQPGILFGDGLFEGYDLPSGSIYGSYGNLYQFRFNMTGVRGNHAMKWAWRSASTAIPLSSALLPMALTPSEAAPRTLRLRFHLSAASTTSTLAIRCPTRSPDCSLPRPTLTTSACQPNSLPSAPSSTQPESAARPTTFISRTHGEPRLA